MQPLIDSMQEIGIKGIRKLLRIAKRILNTVYCICKYRNIILIDCWVEQWFGDLKHRNFGDELNIYLIESLTGCKVINHHNTFFSGDRVLAIGSIIESYISPNSIIWGSGAMHGYGNICKPKSVYAVRGKLTREFLISNHIDCPEIYGDPALLLPYIYNRPIEKKYKYGLIPHIVDLDNPFIQHFLHNNDHTLLISFQNYKDWHDIIDQIKSCENIISSSLHGLIVSDAYGIPNVWIKVSDKIGGGEFKYKDYFSGVGRNYLPPLLFTMSTTLDEIDILLCKYKKINPDLRKLLDACPLKINRDLVRI